MAKKVLIVDDSQSALLPARTTLAALGCEISLVRSGADAMDQAYEGMVSQLPLMKVRTYLGE